MAETNHDLPISLSQANLFHVSLFYNMRIFHALPGVWCYKDPTSWASRLSASKVMWWRWGHWVACSSNVSSSQQLFLKGGGSPLLGSSLNGFACSRVGVCGLEIVGRQNRDTETQNTVGRVIQGILSLLACIYFAHSRKREEAKDRFNMTQWINRAITSWTPKASKN